METTKFERKGVLYQLYLMTFLGEDLPTDTCSFRGRLIVSFVISLLLLPLTIIRLAYRAIIYATVKSSWDREDKLTNGVKGFPISAFVFGIPAFVGNMVLKRVIDGYIEQGDVSILLWDNFTLTILISFIIGLITIALILGAIIGGVYLIVEKLVPWIKAKRDARRDRIYEERRLSPKPEPIEVKPSQAAVLYNSLKERYCKKIEWN